MAPGPTWGPQAQTKDSLPATEEVGQGGSEPTRHPSESPPLRALEVNPSAEGRRRGGGGGGSWEAAFHSVQLLRGVFCVT